MLSRTIKLQVFTEVINLPNFLGKYTEYDGILAFLNKIWNLKELPSEDTRYKNAYGDTNQHMVNNSDWTYEYLFLERFKLIDDDEEYFINFIEAIVNPTVRKDKEDISFFVSKINSIIQPTGNKLILTDYFESLPVYRYKAIADFNDLPNEIIPNQIIIYVEEPKEDKVYPCFKLDYYHWDDYGYKTTFNLYYYRAVNDHTYIGRVKIMKRGSPLTETELNVNFTSLSPDYCSLGQRRDYYIRLKAILKEDYSSFLLALRDVATFPKIHEEFENDEIFKTSIIRINETERLARTVRFEIEGIKREEYYKFNYKFKPPYSEEAIVFNFDFEYDTDFEHRIYALIGKNGTGKTRILSSLAKSLSEKEPYNFTPRKPVYGKVFTVSYSFFDRFDIPSRDASFNYVYCGLKKEGNTWKTEDDLLMGFYQSVSLIKEKKIEKDWYDIIRNFIDQEILDYVFLRNPRFGVVFLEDKFGEIRQHLSSGQSIILFIVSEIFSQIRFDSLILFDEPETHLHPNAINSLLNTLFELVKKFESFCVIATHSPIIIQEIPARNIFVIEREDNNAFVRILERESFGENLTVITQDIFGTREEPRHFISIIEELISKGKAYPEILSLLESNNLPVTSNIRLYIKALMPANG